MPLEEDILMWWNFIGRSHEEIVEFRREWQSEIAAFAAGDPASTVFGRVTGYPGAVAGAGDARGAAAAPAATGWALTVWTGWPSGGAVEPTSSCARPS